MDQLPKAPLVIGTVFILLTIILTMCYWCCTNNTRLEQDEALEEVKVTRLRLRIGSDFASELSLNECINIFELEEDQPPPYEHPPTYKSVYYNTVFTSRPAADVLALMTM